MHTNICNFINDRITGEDQDQENEENTGQEYKDSAKHMKSNKKGVHENQQNKAQERSGTLLLYVIA